MSPLVWRARCRGAAGPAGGKLSRHAARGPRCRDRGGPPVISDWRATAITKDIPGASVSRRYARLRGFPGGTRRPPGGSERGFEASAQDAGERVRQPPQRVVALGPAGRAGRRRRRGRPRMRSTRTKRGRSARTRPRAFSAPARRPLRACRAVTAVLLPGARVVGLVAAWFLRALPPVRRRGSPPGSAGARAPVMRPRRAGTGRSQRPGAGRSSPPPALAGP